MATRYGIPQAFQQAFGQTVVNKNPGDPVFYDFRFEHQGPATRVHVRALTQDQITSQFLDMQVGLPIDLPQATTWRVQAGRINFALPSGMPASTYFPYIRICDLADCSGALSVLGWNLDLWLQVGAQLPQFGIQNALVTGFG